MNEVKTKLSEHLQSVYESSNSTLDMLGGGTDEVLIQIHATLDDVGNCKKDGMCAVAGFVAYTEEWKKFNWRWIMSLQQLGRDHLHTSKYLNEFYLSDGKLTDDDICLILAPFIAAAREALVMRGAVPIAVITECEAYDQLSEVERKFIRPPEEHSFEVAAWMACRVLRHPLQISDAVAIQMDESENAPALYARYQDLKRKHPDIKQNLSAICFCDDRRHAPVQAADMLANVVLKLWRSMEKGKEPPRAIREMTVLDDGPRLKLMRFGIDDLRRVAKARRDRSDKMAMPDP